MKKLLVYLFAFLFSLPLLAMEVQNNEIEEDPHAKLAYQIVQRYKKKAADLEAFLKAREEEQKNLQENLQKDESKSESQNAPHPNIGFVPNIPLRLESIQSNSFKAVYQDNKENIDTMIFIFENYQYYLKLKQFMNIEMQEPLEQLVDPYFYKHCSLIQSQYCGRRYPIRLKNYSLMYSSAEDLGVKEIWKNITQRYFQKRFCLNFDEIMEKCKEYMFKQVGGQRPSNYRIDPPKTQELNRLRMNITNIFGSNLNEEAEKITRWLTAISLPLDQRRLMPEILKHQYRKRILRGSVSEASLQEEEELLDDIKHTQEEIEILSKFAELKINLLDIHN